MTPLLVTTAPAPVGAGITADCTSGPDRAAYTAESKPTVYENDPDLTSATHGTATVPPDVTH